MRIYQVGPGWEDTAPPSVVCLGVFDGVHLGHAKLIKTSLEIARKEGLRAIVHTYDPLPVRVLQPERNIIELTPLEERLRLMETLGAMTVAVSTFDTHLSQMSGEAFFQQILLEQLSARYIVAGFNHRFGFHADTDIPKLQTLCDRAGIGLSVIEPVHILEGSLVSSTAIRAALLLGDEGLAAEMLGRPVDAAMLSRANQTTINNTQNTLEG